MAPCYTVDIPSVCHSDPPTTSCSCQIIFWAAAQCLWVKTVFFFGCNTAPDHFIHFCRLNRRHLLIFNNFGIFTGRIKTKPRSFGRFSQFGNEHHWAYNCCVTPPLDESSPSLTTFPPFIPLSMFVGLTCFAGFSQPKSVDFPKLHHFLVG